MNKRSLVVPLLTLLATSLSFGASAPATQLDPQSNAATFYNQAFASFPVNNAVWKVLDRWDTIPLNSESDGMIAEGETALRLIHEGAKLSVCAWGLDMSKGPGTMLPFLNKTRAVMDLACLRARFEFQEGQFTAGVDDICDNMTLARHSAVDGFLVEVLVRSGAEEQAVRVLAQHLKEMDKGSITELIARLKNLPTSATLGDAVAVAKKIDVDWMIDRLQKSTPDSDPAEVFGPFYSDTKTSKAFPAYADAINAAGGTRDGVVHQLQALIPYFDGVDKLLRQSPTQEDFHSKSADLHDQFNDNPFAGLMLLQYSRAFDTLAREQTEMAMLQSAIAIVQSGPDKARDLQDPVNHQPIAYEETANGFELESTVTSNEKPVTLKIGQ
jgi:hypothetical protein